MVLFFGVFYSGDVWPRGSQDSVEYLWRKGDFIQRTLSLDEQSKLTDDLERNDRNKYGINPPPTGGPLRCLPL